MNTEKYFLLRRLRHRNNKAIFIFSLVIIVIVASALSLPAITQSREAYCGLQEHTHTEECYNISYDFICPYFDEETTAQETVSEESTTAEAYEDETTQEITTEEISEETTEEVTTEEITTEETMVEEIIEETTEGESTREVTTEEPATEEITTDETTEEAITEEITSREAHKHTEECYQANKTLLCELTEHTHSEICFAEDIAVSDGMYDTMLMADGEDAISPLADAENPITRVNFDDLDGSGETYYLVFTTLNNKYYAVDGNGKAVAITVNSDGTVSLSSANNNLYWSFISQGGAAYTIQNLGTSRYMHSYNNSTTDYGITTSGNYPSNLEVSGTGSSKTFAVKSNSNYSRIVASGSSAAFQTTTSSSSAAQFYLAEVYVPKDAYHVWFDGTCGGIMSLYESPNEYLRVPGNSNTITLPETWESPSKYTYTLNGWYDIKNHKYYKPGDLVTVTRNTVFYADWVAGTYDVGIANEDNINLIAPSLDTNSFIRTDMFDYSAVFNVQAVTHTGSVSASSHSETWTVVQNSDVPYKNVPSLGFTFRDWDSGGVNISYAGNRARLNDNIGTEITSGIVDYVKNMSGRDIIDILFNPGTDIIGKNYVGKANYLYQFMEEGSEDYDGIHNGYYYYDSKFNAASYNQTNERFYIYKYLERTSDSLKDGGGGEYSDFLPFNSPYVNNHNNKTVVTYTDGDGVPGNYQYDAKATNQQSNIANVGTNYWFGMKSEIKFYLPDDTGTVDAYQNYGNISSHGQHMTFEFSGDDDMWVFIDGKLVMDIGGLHGIMTGKIDFSTGTITTSEAAPISAGSSAGSGVEVSKSLDLSEGDHTLTVYYMERGGSQSNCAIYFNITPRYALEFTKLDAISGEGLDGAVFGVYLDVDCTKPAELWTSQSAYQNGEDATNVFTTVNGKISVWGVSAGKVYYIKELTAPQGYPITDDILRISMNNLGGSICTADILRGGDGLHTDGFDIVHSTADESRQQLAIKIANQKDAGPKRNVAVQKNWNVEDESLIPESVTVYLTANGQNTGKTAVLSDVNDWSYVWINLPVYDSNGNVINYGVYEEQAEGFFTDVAVDDNLHTINAWVQTDAFYDGGIFLIVDRSSATDSVKGKALSVNSSGNFEWIAFEDAKENPSAHWVVNADEMGFHVVNESGYHIILNGTSSFVPDKDGNRVLYYDKFGLAARNNNVYYYLNNNFTASADSHLDIELYINMDILVHEEGDSDGESFEEGEIKDDGKIVVTMFNVTNTHIDEQKKTSFKVKKTWSDGAINHISDSITVKLFADGKDTGRTLTLSQSNNWETSFEGLLYEDDEGNKISYTVEEVEFSGYWPEYSEITEVEGGTVNKTEYAWNTKTTTGFTANSIYRFVNSNGYALTANENNTSLTVAKSDESDKYQQWKYYNNRLINVGKSESGTNYYLYRSGTSLSLSTSNGTTPTLASASSGFRLRFGSYYTVMNENNSTPVSANRSSSNGTILTVSELTEITVPVAVPNSYSISVNNQRVSQVLPETGGRGTAHLYIIGGLLMALSSVFLLCLYKNDRERRRRCFKQ